MSIEAVGESKLENVMFRLMDQKSGENTDYIDTMIMISLVNLLGIISAMNKQDLTRQAARSADEDQMISTLLSMLAQGQTQQGGQGGGMQGITPALLMSLLGSRGQRPENAVLLALLSSLMQQQPGPQRYQERDRPQHSFSPPVRSKKTSEESQKAREKEIRMESNPNPWDRRLK